MGCAITEAAWHQRSIPAGSRRFDLLNRRRQSHTGRLEDRPACALDLTSQPESLPLLLHVGRHQVIQVQDDVPPFQIMSPLLQPRLQLLTHHQGQE